MANNSAMPAPSALSADLLKSVALDDSVTAKDAETARELIRAKGGYFPENGSDFLAVVAASVINPPTPDAVVGRGEALSFALIDESQEYKRLLSPYGEPFKSVQELIRAMFPTLADSTVYNYLNAGKEIYLPASRGALPDDLMILAMLAPGTALSAVGVLRDKIVRKYLPKALKDAMEPDGKLTQSRLKAAVKAAKEAARQDKERRNMYELRETDENALICDGAKVMGDVTLGKGVSVWHNAVIRGDDGAIVVGDNTNIQDCAVLHEETTIGRGCTIGHGAIVHGCTVGDNTLVGMGSIILNGARIGNDCIVGAGSVVTGKMDAPDGSMILGSPAKVVRALKPEEIEANRASALGYLETANACRNQA